MIVYLQDGEIIEQGSHEELLARRGAYYELYRRQSLEREVETLVTRGRTPRDRREHHEDEILGKAYDARLMVRILRYLRPYWKLLAVSFVFLLLQTGAPVLGPYITKIAIDRYIAQRDIHGLDVMALAYLGVVLFGFVVLFIQTYTTEYTGQRAMHDLRMEIFSHLQKQDMAYFDRHAVGRL